MIGGPLAPKKQWEKHVSPAMFMIRSTNHPNQFCGVHAPGTTYTLYNNIKEIGWPEQKSYTNGNPGQFANGHLREPKTERATSIQ